MPRKGQLLPVPVGQRFARVVVLGLAGQDERGISLWRCLCDCGREAVLQGSRLRRGRTTSCGCAQQRPRVNAGERFGRLVALERVSAPGAHSVAWMCRCDCGSTTRVASSSLRSGNATSCGCRQRELAGAQGRSNATHGHSRHHQPTPTYRSWSSMLARCTNPSDHAWADYGGRGIRVCDRWRESFEAFLADMGERPEGKTLDRFPNCDGNYEPGNCRWATDLEQQNNRRDCNPITVGVETMTAAEWSRRTGVKAGTIRFRLSRGWPPAAAVSEPPSSSRRPRR